MTNYKIKRGDMEFWLITVCMSYVDAENKNNVKINPDGTIPIKFEVGGVELDFLKVAARLERSIDDMIKHKAKDLLDEKYSDLLNQITDIQERLECQKDDFFKYDYEKDE